MSWHGREAHSGPVPVDDTGGPDQLLDAYFEAASGAISRNTERALRADVNVFTTWCRGRRTAPFPASPEMLVAFINEMTSSRTPATVRRYLSSITTVQKGLGERSPLENASVRFALQRMHRRRGRRQTQVHGLTWPLRNRLLEAAGDRLIDARNRALLGVGYDTLLRRSELVALRVEDVLKEMDGSATVLLRAGKTDAEGRGTALFLARDTVELVNAWRQRGRVGDGRLFRGIGRHGRLHERLDASQVPRIYKQMARQAGLPDEIVEALGGHSTRVGAVQDMIACGIELPAILQSGRWKTTRMVQRYGERLLARRSGAAQLAERQGR